MTYEVVVTRQAESDLADAHAYIAADAPEEAERWLRGLKRKTRSLRRYPRRCGTAPEAKTGEDIRQLLVGLFRVVFLIDRKRIYILAVVRSARLPVSEHELESRLKKRRRPR